MSNYGLQQLFGPAPVGDIGRNGKVLWAGRETARCFELVKNFLGSQFVRAVADCKAHTSAAQYESDFLADPMCSTRYQGDAILK
jgi:hypothetical protein